TCARPQEVENDCALSGCLCSRKPRSVAGRSGTPVVLIVRNTVGTPRTPSEVRERAVVRRVVPRYRDPWGKPRELSGGGNAERDRPARGRSRSKVREPRRGAGLPAGPTTAATGPGRRSAPGGRGRAGRAPGGRCGGSRSRR